MISPPRPPSPPRTGSGCAVFRVAGEIFSDWQSLFLAAHTPDNSFLGFVVEQHLNASDIKHIDDVKRQNQSLVYGKVDNFWKVRGGGAGFLQFTVCNDQADFRYIYIVYICGSPLVHSSVVLCVFMHWSFTR